MFSCIQSQSADVQAGCRDSLSSALDTHLQKYAEEEDVRSATSSLLVLTLTDSTNEETQENDVSMRAEETMVADVGLRGTVDIINGLLENFPVGEECLRCVWQRGN